MSSFHKGFKKLNLKGDVYCPNHKLTNTYIYYKKRIKQLYPKYKRDFFTWDYLHEEFKGAFADVIFLSKKKKIVYFGVFTLAQSEMVSKVHNLLWDLEFNDLYTKYNLDKDFEFIPHETDVYGNAKSYTMNTKEHDKIRPELNNKNYFDYTRDRITEYLIENKPVMYEEYKVEPNYYNNKRSIQFILDEQYINQTIIEKHINKFYELGEISWKSDIPISQDRLCYSYNWNHEWELPLGVPLDEDLFTGKRK